MTWKVSEGPETMIQAFKDKLAKGETILVVNPDHPAPSLVESPGRLPIDAVWIDCEQGATGKAAGILVDRDNLRRYRGQGVTFLYAHANAFLSRGASDFADLLAKR